jgi:hypothetical protein
MGTRASLNPEQSIGSWRRDAPVRLWISSFFAEPCRMGERLRSGYRDYPRLYPVGIDHQDHIAVARAAFNVVHRKPMVEGLLQVEPSRGSRSFEPNMFVDVSEFVSKKLDRYCLPQVAIRIRTIFSRLIWISDRAGGPLLRDAQTVLNPMVKCTSRPFVSRDVRSSRPQCLHSANLRVPPKIHTQKIARCRLIGN